MSNPLYLPVTLKSGTDEENAAYTGLLAEAVFTTDTYRLYVHDGETAGGHLVSGDLIHDTSPQLGGDLDANGCAITSADNGDVVISPHGTGAIVAMAGGNDRGSYAVDLCRSRSNDSQVASGAYSVNAGCHSTASGDYSSCFGNGCTASGGGSIAAGLSTTASGSGATVFGGACVASGNYTFVLGGMSAATADYAIAMGSEAAASAIGAIATGNVTVANGNYSMAHGVNTFATANYAIATGCHATASHVGQRAHGVGDSTYQTSEYALTGGTPSVTPVTLSQPEKFTLADNTVYDIFVKITAWNAAEGGLAASYWRRVLIQRLSGTVSLATPIQTIGTDYESNASLDVTITANDTDKSLDITVTGLASTVVGWIAAMTINENAMNQSGV